MSEHSAEIDAPPGPPSHTHDDGTVCYFDVNSLRWWWQEADWPHKPVACPGRVLPPAKTDGGAA